MILKPQDILVLLKLVVVSKNSWAYHSLAVELGMSQSEVHSAIKRSISDSLAIQSQDKIIPYYRNLEEFIVHGIRFVFVPKKGELVRGMSFSPLYKSAPKAARMDSRLYELLVLVDVIRGGQARERSYAINEIRRRLVQ